MALNKEKSYKGITLSYWCITSTSWNKEDANTSCILTPFVDSEARQGTLENAFPQPQRAFTFANPVSSSGVQQYTLEQLYDLIKASDDFFSDAEDC